MKQPKLLCLFIMLVSCVSFAQQTVVVDSMIVIRDIRQSVLIFKDSTTTLPFELIRQQHFRAYSTDFLLNSFASDILWLHFKVQNKDADTLKLILNAGKHFFLDLYQIHQNNQIKKHTGGVFVSWKNLIDGYGMPITLAPQEASEIYLRIGADAFYTKNLLVVPKLFTERFYIDNQHNSFWTKRFLGFLFAFTIGFLISGIIVALFQYYILPNKAILYYIIIIAFSEIMIFRVAEYHLNIRIISSFFPTFFGHLYIIQTVLGFTYFLFIASMFNTKQLRPRTHQFIKKMAYFYLVVLAVCVWSTFSILHNRSIIGSSFQIAGLLTILTVVFIIIVIYLAYVNINSYNKYIVYGFVCMIIGYVITFYLNRTQALEYNNFWKIPSVYMCLGTAGELVFFMIALSQRSRLLEKESLSKGQIIERKRIAIELHDNVNSILASVKASLQTIKPQNQKENQVYEHVLKMVDSATKEVRQISHNMLPVELEKEGLGHALLSLVLRLNLSGQTKFELNLNDFKQNLSPEIAFNLYSICLELCQNIQKHAEASQAQIEFKETSDSVEHQLIMFVSDNGKGFEKAKIVEGIGLKSIQHRAKSIGADLRIQSNIGEGTVVYLKLPFSQSSHV